MASANRNATALLRSAAVCTSLRPANLLEITAFAKGVKPSLRFVVSPGDAAILLGSAKMLGLAACSRGVFLATAVGTWNEMVTYRTQNPAELVVISHDDPHTVLDAELSDSTEAGLLLGYPQCCMRSISNLAKAAGNWPFALLSGSGACIDARLNRFAAEWGGIGLIGELFPCSLHCRAAASYSQSLYDAACALGLVKLAAAAKSDALEPVHIDAHGLISLANSAHRATVSFF